MTDSTILSILDSHGLGAVVLVVVAYLARSAPAFLAQATALAKSTVVLVGRLSDLADAGTTALQLYLHDRGGAVHDSGEVVIARKVAQGRIDEVRAELEQLDAADSLHGRLARLAGELARLELELRRSQPGKGGPKKRITVVPTSREREPAE